MSTVLWTAFTLALVTSALCISNYAQRIEKKELFNTIEAQGNAAKELVNEINIRHNNALVVQEIGQVTSTIIDIDRLVREAMSIVKRYLLYDRGMIMLADQENRKLLFHTGYGYGPDTERFLKKIEYPIDKSAMHDVIPAAFLAQRPFLFNSIASQDEKDSSRSELFARIGTQSFICVPVIYEKTSLGVLVVDNKESKKHLTQSDMSLLMGIASQIAVGINNAFSFQKIHENENALQRSHDELELRVEERTAELETLNRELNMEITERQLSEERLMASLKEKDVLLKEVHHRVKNNLQIISSLLDMSKRRAKHPETIDLLSEAHAKIFTMSLIHTQLYQSDRFDEINMGKYIRDLTTQLAQFHCGDRNISLQINSPEIYLSVTQAIPCAFIINELILNAFKYAFTDKKTGTIEITLQKLDADKICLNIKDDGVGIPKEVDIDNTETLGIKLVRNLVFKQLKGDFKINTDRGTEIDIEFRAVTT
jgi:two-component sensor histidine kinase